MRAGQFAQVFDVVVGDDLAAEPLKLADERVGDGLCPTTHHRPADRVGEGPEGEAERRRQRPVQAEHRVGGDAGEQGPCRLVLEAAASQSFRRTQGRGREPEAGHRQRPTWDVDDGPQQLPCQAPRVGGRGARTTVPRRGRPHRPNPSRRSQRTDRSSSAARPPSSGWATGASGCRNSTPRAARSTVRKNGDAIASGRIVEQTSCRNPGRVSSWVRVPPPAVRGGLVDPDRAPGAGQRHRRGQPVGPGSDDDRIDRTAIGRHRVRPRRPEPQGRRGRRDGPPAGSCLARSTRRGIARSDSCPRPRPRTPGPSARASYKRVRSKRRSTISPGSETADRLQDGIRSGASEAATAIDPRPGRRIDASTDDNTRTPAPNTAARTARDGAIGDRPADDPVDLEQPVARDRDDRSRVAPSSRRSGGAGRPGPRESAPRIMVWTAQVTVASAVATIAATSHRYWRRSSPTALRARTNRPTIPATTNPNISMYRTMGSGNEQPRTATTVPGGTGSGRRPRRR